MEDYIFLELAELLEQNKIRKLRFRLTEINEVDVAEFISQIEPEEKMPVVFRILPKDMAATVFAYLDSDAQEFIVSSMNHSELNLLLDELFVDDAVDFLEEMPANVVKRILSHASSETRTAINRVLNYPENSAGSEMTTEMVELHSRLTVKEAIKNIRKTGIDKETIYNCYVIDDQRHLIGDLPLRHLLLAKDDELIADIMDDEEQIISVNTFDDREEVADIARKYDLLSVPVVDNENRLVGIITIDDIVDIIEEENTEDFQKMALMAPSDDEYLKTGIFKMFSNRILWLLILMISATFTGQIIEGAERSLAGIVAGLTACIPMLMDTGGNAGNQTSTMIIRGLARGEIDIKDYFKVLFKEVRVALLCGTVLAGVNFLRMLVLSYLGISSNTLNVILIVCASMLCAVVIAKCIGCTLPIIAKVLKLDPALMAGPMITTIVDAITLAVYFGLAKAFLM